MRPARAEDVQRQAPLVLEARAGRERAQVRLDV